MRLLRLGCGLAAIGLAISPRAEAQIPPVLIEPANLPPDSCELAAGEPWLVVPESGLVEIDTDLDCDRVITQDEAPPLCALLRGGIAVGANGELRVRGSRVAALVAAGSMSIAGRIDASADGEQSGPGAAATSGGDASAGAGGGGGGHASAGASGGFYEGGGGGLGGSAIGVGALEPLSTGGAGGSNGIDAGGWGGGGGAIELVACDSFELHSTGIVNAGGGGGAGGLGTTAGFPPHGGGGGGSGGAILIQSDNVFLQGTVAANGGGGGGGGNRSGGAGQGGSEGPIGDAPAQGGMPATGAGWGGFGGSLLSATGAGQDTAGDGGAGGGGGSAGRIRIGGCANLMNFATVSPAPELVNECVARIFASGFENGRLTVWTEAACGQGTTVNETDLPAEADYCNLQWPLTMSAAAGQPTATVYGRIYEADLTPAPGPPAGVIAEVGFARRGSNPRHPADVCGWKFTTASFNVQYGNDDEFQASFVAPQEPGEYRYTYRFSRDGQSWTYCDTDGAGSLPTLSFSPEALGLLTVTP